MPDSPLPKGLRFFRLSRERINEILDIWNINRTRVVELR